MRGPGLMRCTLMGTSLLRLKTAAEFSMAPEPVVTLKRRSTILNIMSEWWSPPRALRLSSVAMLRQAGHYRHGAGHAPRPRLGRFIRNVEPPALARLGGRSARRHHRVHGDDRRHSAGLCTHRKRCSIHRWNVRVLRANG